MGMEPVLSDAAEREPAGNALAEAIGSRLRAVRHQMGLSLQAVAAMSNGEFRTSVLGAYERGDRVITVPRLQRLAKLYAVPVGQLLPPENTSGSGEPEADEMGATSDLPRVGHRKVSIDLATLKGEAGPEPELVRRFLNMIQLQRQDFNGRMITIRNGDLRVIACLIGVTPDAMGHRLDDLGLLVAS